MHKFIIYTFATAFGGLSVMLAALAALAFVDAVPVMGVLSGAGAVLAAIFLYDALDFAKRYKEEE